jgi:hypothetical protein
MHGPACSVILTRLEKQARDVTTEIDLVYVHGLVMVYYPISHLESLPYFNDRTSLSFILIHFKTLLLNYIPTNQTISLNVTYLQVIYSSLKQVQMDVNCPVKNP